jgi:hypothetical protein
LRRGVENARRHALQISRNCNTREDQITHEPEYWLDMRGVESLRISLP